LDRHIFNYTIDSYSNLNIGSISFLTGNSLKLIAALSMLIDHIGYMFFPKFEILRIIGRLSFPIFSYMLAEGCFYTHSKLKYFLSVFLLGIVCQVVYYICDKSLDLGILITFSLSVITIFSLNKFKEKLFTKGTPLTEKICFGILFCLVTGLVYIANEYFVIDYGFWGSMTAVFASALRFPKGEIPSALKRLDNHTVHILMFGISLIILSIYDSPIQMYSLFALPLLLLYSGSRGRLKLKIFFYIFYPLHFVVLRFIELAIK